MIVLAFQLVHLFADAEVTADGERLGLLSDLGLLFDLGRTLRLALDPFRTWWIRACRFALRAPALSLAVGAGVTLRAALLSLP